MENEPVQIVNVEESTGYILLNGILVFIFDFVISFFTSAVTHLYQINASTLTLWSVYFNTRSVKLGFSVAIFFLIIPVQNAISVDSDEMPRSAVLIWIYTVCQCPFDRTLGINH